MKIRIDALDYDLLNTTGPLILNNQQCRGLIDYHEKTITIDTSQGNDSAQFQTLWHEIIHGLIRERGLDYGQCDEESFVDELAKGMVQMIRDNPLLFNYPEEGTP